MPESQGEPDRKFQEIDLELEEAMRRAGMFGKCSGDFVEDAVQPAAVR